MREYDRIAEWYATDRSQTIGVAQALAVAATLSPGSRILDLGCGNGTPIAASLVKAGYRVVGVDTSAAMLVRFRATLPDAPAVHADARRCPFQNGCFDAAISWGMMFHLSRGDQAMVFESLSGVLKPGAPFLFTGTEIEDTDDAGITGTMNGVTFHYYAVQSYQALMAEHGFVLAEVYDDPGVSTYYLAHKTA